MLRAIARQLGAAGAAAAPGAAVALLICGSISADLAKSVQLNLPNSGGLVFGSIEAYFCEQTLAL